MYSTTSPHRNLHSFPTRRSSDLWLLRQTDGQWITIPSSSTSTVRPTSSSHGSRWPRPARRQGKRKKHKLSTLTSARDRKSTRLNSSHPSISYAVFCLKKKKIL